MEAGPLAGESKEGAQPWGHESVDEHEGALGFEHPAHFSETSLLVGPVMKGNRADDEVDCAGLKGKLLSPADSYRKASPARGLDHAGGWIDAE